MIEAILNYEFLQNAFFSGLIIGVIAPLLGVFIVVRRLSLIADALSHVTLAGIAGSLYLSQSVAAFALLNPIYLGIIASVSGSILIERLRRLYKHYEELAIPIIMSGGIGISAIFISLASGFNTDLMSYLFGSVSAVSRQDLWVVAAIAVVVVLFLFFFFKELFVLSFDEEYANRQKELDEDYQRKQKELDDNNQTEKEQMIASSKKYEKLCSFEYTKCGVVVILCLVCALIGVYSFIIALCHGLLPTLIDDGKSFISWITTNWKGMFHSPFDFSNVRSIFNLLIPLVILALSVIWTIYDYDYEDKEWVIMADGDKVSIAVLGSAISLSAFFGKWISAIHINTVVLPFIIYEIYFLIRSGFITRLLEIIFTIISSILEAAIDKLSEKKSNEIVGSLLLIVIIGAAAIWFFSLFKK